MNGVRAADPVLSAQARRVFGNQPVDFQPLDPRMPEECANRFDKCRRCAVASIHLGENERGCDQHDSASLRRH